jgi:hypothetical protein
MSLSRGSRSSARLLNAQEHEDDRNKNNERPDITQTQSNTSAGKLESGSPNRQIKRERTSSEPFSAKSSKIERCVLTSDVKTESLSAAICERHKRYQSSVEEVYLHGSYAESDCAQNGSPRTPTLSHSAAKHVSRFMESFAAAFPSESEDLMVLLDAFIERR